MDARYGTSEIIELVEDTSVTSGKDGVVKPGQRFSIGDDINRLFESIDFRNSARNLSSSQVGRENLRKKSMKRPVRVDSSHTSKIGISESTSLKQALRGLCISQASEMAALKRLSKSPGLSGISEAVTIKRLYGAVEVSKSGHPLNDGNLVEISLVPERHSSNLSEKISETLHVSKLANHTAGNSFSKDPSIEKIKMVDSLQQTECFSLPSDVRRKTSKMELGLRGNTKLKLSLISNHNKEKLPVVDEIVPASVQEIVDTVKQETQQKPELNYASYLSISNPSNEIARSASSAPKLLKPIFRSKNLAKKKSKLDSTSVSSSSRLYSERICNDSVPSTSKVYSHMPDHYFSNISPVARSTNASLGVSLSSVDSSTSKPDLIADCGERSKPMVTKADEKSRSRAREKAEFSQSSKSSLGEFSSSTSFSDESHLSGSSLSGCKPHMSRDLRWEAVCCVQKLHGSLSLRHFRLLRKIGGGDIGTVYLAELTGSKCLFALKVMDNEFLALRKKISRAQTEREILQLLDHPFLPTLFGHFTSEKFACLVMEYCPGGDLHVLRQKQMGKYFSEQAVRFYVAEVLLALEYLHMLGVVYRDLKPENILVREDGHIMLTDFDLSFRCAPNQTLLKPSSPIIESPKKVSCLCTESSCIDPFCLQPTWQVRCFTPRLLCTASKSRKLKSELAFQVSPLPQLVVEPTSARSNSFVGTHEYLAPEIIKGEGHGSPVDWWTFGILLYELLYGRTPFKGTGNEDTIVNVVSKCLKFPESPTVSSHAKDLIKRLLRKQPEKRLGSVKGAAEIKQHPFFEGLNWALIRCAAPPEMPRTSDIRSTTPEVSSLHLESAKCEKEFTGTGENMLFEMF